MNETPMKSYRHFLLPFFAFHTKFLLHLSEHVFMTFVHLQRDVFLQFSKEVNEPEENQEAKDDLEASETIVNWLNAK